MIEPSSFEEAKTLPEIPRWEEAMHKEFNMLKERKNYEDVARPIHGYVLGCRWVYKAKTNEIGQFKRFWVRLVAQGYSQREGIGYFEVL